MLKWSSSGAAHSPFISAVTRSFMEFNPRAGIMMMTITVMLIKKSIIITLIKSPRQQRSTPRREMMQINCKDEAIRRAEEEEQGSQSGRMARAACLLTKIFLPTHTLTDNLDCSVAELIGETILLNVKCWNLQRYKATTLAARAGRPTENERWPLRHNVKVIWFVRLRSGVISC